ncbi:MAG TPA: hypothetical protein VLA00_06380 [Xanthobacteraceae bacterium]|nr:hypothetical protein [Xanthobacteraceae bacterium]
MGTIPNEAVEERTTVVLGAGWLRAPGAASSTARYTMAVRHGAKALREGFGRLKADFDTLCAAERAGRASLILSNGERVAIELKRTASEEAEFKVVGALPAAVG